MRPARLQGRASGREENATLSGAGKAARPLVRLTALRMARALAAARKREATHARQMLHVCRVAMESPVSKTLASFCSPVES